MFFCICCVVLNGGFFFPGQKNPFKDSPNSEDVQCNLCAVLNDRYNVHIVGIINDNNDKPLGGKAKASHRGVCESIDVKKKVLLLLMSGLRLQLAF